MSAYDPDQWHDFAVAGAGAAAALTGLLFVAISINLPHILKFRSLPGRAAATLSLLVVLLLVSMFVLVPDQSATALGIELGLCGAALAAIAARTATRAHDTAEDEGSHAFVSTLLMLVPASALAIGGVSVGVGRGGGLLWILGAVLSGFVSASTNAWVLLVEIER